MKKKLLFVIIVFSQLGFSQKRIDSSSPFFKGIKVEKIDDEKLSHINNAKFYWDFTSLDINRNQVSIEIVAIYDCFNDDKATDFKNQFEILKDDDFLDKGNHLIVFSDLMTKCFKWRIVIRNEDEYQVSNWSQFSFLK